MKMEINIAARMSGILDEVLVDVGQTVKAGELLAIIK
jgi:biotin carboxyl carrier protein